LGAKFLILNILKFILISKTTKHNKNLEITFPLVNIRLNKFVIKKLFEKKLKINKSKIFAIKITTKNLNKKEGIMLLPRLNLFLVILSGY
tara:strand:+ start:1517 stop:1786 length:270 start_codon:yes stop_codon:yes gene_type:complete